MSGPVSGHQAGQALTPDLAARALVSACRLLGHDPATAFEPKPDGRGRARQLAAAALVDHVHRPKKACARVMKVHPACLALSALKSKRLTAEDLQHVRAEVFAAEQVACADGHVLSHARDAMRGEAGWVHPGRDLAREARTIEARLKGEGPTEIAAREKVGRVFVNRVLGRSGQTFPGLKRGPKVGSYAPVRGQRAPASASPQARPAPAPRPEPPAPEPVTPFPKGRSPWDPLPDSTPVLLVDHRHGCRWPVEIEGAVEPMVCDLSPVVAGLYCSRHRWLSLAKNTRAPALDPQNKAA